MAYTTLASNTSGNQAQEVDFNGDMRIGQTFKITSSTDVVCSGVQLSIYPVSSPTGDMLLTLRSCDPVTNVPSATILATATQISCASLVASQYNTVNFIFSTPVVISPEVTYAFVFGRASGNWTASTDSVLFSYSTDNPYISGRLYYQSGSGAFTDNTGTYSIDADADLQFYVLGTPGFEMCSYADILAKAGADVNALAILANTVLIYLRQSQSVLNVRTKLDWTAIYSTLSDNKKYILSEILSSLTAIKIINYDTGQIGSLDAQRRMDNLSYDVETYIEALKDSEIKSFVQAA